MSDVSKAVFLSYASQDAEAAKRICDSLRAAGVEVWFDQSELVGGDAWDAKIRKHIKECTLLIPVISANTQARTEGYFRLEWRLADQRTHLMAKGRPFLLPVVIDDTRDAEAHVPDSFTEVQWTRLKGGEATPAFVARVQKLLSNGNDSVGGALRPDNTASSGHKAPPTTIPTPSRRVYAGLAVAAFAIAGAAGWWILRERPAETTAKPAVEAPAKTAAVPEPAKAAPAPALDPQRVALARFENLTGDATLDPLALLLEAELARGLGGVAGLRLVPLEVGGRAAGRTAARAAGAASVIAGTYSKRGDKVELSAEIVLVEAGEIFGSLGSAALPATAPRGRELEEFVDRLALGAEFAAGMLRSPPTRFTADIPNRIWPRRSHVLKARGIRLSENSAAGYASVIGQYLALLAEAPEMVDIKQELARAYVGAGRFEEAQKLYRELLGPDLGMLAESEIYSCNYDEAMLLGSPERALAMALLLLEIRPMGDASRKVVSSLWALSRPREARQRMVSWWEQQQSKATERERQWVEQGLNIIEAIMCHWEGRPLEALEALERQRKAASGQSDFSYQTYKLAALSALGREAEQAALIVEAASQPTASRAEPFHLNWLAYGMALHQGRGDEARRWLAAATKSWDDLSAAARAQPHFQSRSALMLSDAGRHEEALEAARKVEGRSPGLPSALGLMAVVLQAAERREEAADYLKRLEQADTRFTRGQPEYWRARFAAQAGDRVRATELLQQAVSRGLWLGNYNVTQMENGRSEPEFAILRGYAPYEELLKAKG